MTAELTPARRDALTAIYQWHQEKHGWITLPILAGRLGKTPNSTAHDAAALVGLGYVRRSTGSGQTIYRLTRPGTDAARALAGPAPTDEQVRDLAGTMAAQLQAIADGSLTGPRRAAVALLVGNMDTLATWQARLDAEADSIPVAAGGA